MQLKSQNVTLDLFFSLISIKLQTVYCIQKMQLCLFKNLILIKIIKWIFLRLSHMNTHPQAGNKHEKF